MQIDIQSRSLQLTGALLEHVVQRVRHFLAHVRDHIVSVRVQLFDVNGPRGGQDKRCVVQVKLNHLPVVLVEETQVDVRLAVDRALDRAGHTVTHRLERPPEPRCVASYELAQLQLNPRSRTPYTRSIH